MRGLAARCSLLLMGAAACSTPPPVEPPPDPCSPRNPAYWDDADPELRALVLATTEKHVPSPRQLGWDWQERFTAAGEPLATYLVRNLEANRSAGCSIDVRIDFRGPVPLWYLELIGSKTVHQYLRGLVASPEPIDLALRIDALLLLGVHGSIEDTDVALGLLEARGPDMSGGWKLYTTLHVIQRLLARERRDRPETWEQWRHPVVARLRAYAERAPEWQRSFVTSSLDEIDAGISWQDPRYRGGR